MPEPKKRSILTSTSSKAPAPLTERPQADRADPERENVSSSKISLPQKNQKESTTPTTTTSTTSHFKLKRSVRLAVNVSDIHQASPLVLANIIIDPETKRTRLKDGKAFLPDLNRPEEVASEFVCDLYTAALCIDLLRNDARQDKANRHIRAYILIGNPKEAQWKRIAYTTILTKGTELNPDYFPIDVPAVQPVAPTNSFMMRSKKNART